MLVGCPASLETFKTTKIFIIWLALFYPPNHGPKNGPLHRSLNEDTNPILHLKHNRHQENKLQNRTRPSPKVGPAEILPLV